MARKAKCQKCRKPFTMGINGTVDGCDACTGVKRDAEGYAWYPRERVHTYAPIATANDKSTWVTVKRADAFKGKV